MDNLQKKEVDVMAKIGVEQSLSDVQQTLRDKGHNVIELKQEYDTEGCDCCVVTGLDNNVMGMQDTVMKGSVINADGLTAEEVCQAVENKIQ
jgi:hypothetical protein